MERPLPSAAAAPRAECGEDQPPLGVALVDRGSGSQPHMSEPIEVVRLAPQKVLVIRKIVPRTGLGEFFMDAYPRLTAELAVQGATIASMPFSRYYNGDPKAFDVEAGLAFTGTVNAPAWAKVSELPGGEAAKTLHIGPYETLSEEYPRLESWLAEHGKKGAPAPWEVYIDNDEAPPQEPLRTGVYWPIAG